jgi:hypothetical protein
MSRVLSIATTDKQLPAPPCTLLGKLPCIQLIVRLTDQFAPNRILRAAQNGKPDITGFDVRKFGKAAHGARYDPWERKCVSPRPFKSSIEHF